jgi:DNA-binding Lrp family transcriptional regulator
MERVPPRVKRAFGKLRGESHGRIYLKLIKGKHYVYRESGVWDRERKRARVKSEYLGRILEDGTYVKKISSYSDELERAKALILEKGGRIIWPEKQAEAETTNLAGLTAAEVCEIDKRLLTALSMNARASFSSIGRLVGLTTSAAYARVKSLEKMYGIKYTAEVDLGRFGYQTYLILIKFQKEVPSLENLKEELGRDPRIQIGFLTKGEYDLILFVLIDTADGGNLNLNQERAKLFPDRDAKWQCTPMFVSYNFIPMRVEFFEVLKDRVWKRSKETPRQPASSISYGEYCVMLELVRNGVVDFSVIDAKYGFDKGMAQYTYHRLKEKQIIRRMTMSMTGLPVRYLAFLYLENMNDNNWNEHKANLLAQIIGDTDAPANRYSLVGDAEAPSGTVFVLPIFNDADLEKAEEGLKSAIGSARLVTSIVASSLIGTPCFRKFDGTYSTQHYRLVRNYGFKDRPRIKYE